MLRGLRVLSLVALLPPILFAALVVAIQAHMGHRTTLESFGAMVFFMAFTLNITPIVMVSQDLAQRFRAGQWAMTGLWIICFLLELRALDSLLDPPGSGFAAIGGALLLAVPPLLTLAYGEYAARRYSNHQLAG